MGGDSRWGVLLGGVALVVGVAALLLDVPALGVVAGAAGLAAGVLAVRVASRAEAAATAARAAGVELEAASTAMAEAHTRIAGLEAVLRTPPPADEPDNTLTDLETGLPGESFFAISLDNRVAAAKRHLRPVAVVLLEVSDAKNRSAPLGPVAEHLRATLRTADTACRLEGPTRFGLVLEDTPENGAVWTVERFRRSMAATGEKYVLRAGIACYPAHAFDAEDLRQRATDALLAARQWRQDRIEVATASEV